MSYFQGCMVEAVVCKVASVVAAPLVAAYDSNGEPALPGVPFIPALIEDTNGNQISHSGSTGWTYTLGRVIPNPVSTSVSNCPQTPQTPTSARIWNLPASNGGIYPILLCSITLTETITQGGCHCGTNRHHYRHRSLSAGSIASGPCSVSLFRVSCCKQN